MNKVWFVTGASSGIGAGVAKAALEAGHRIVATGRNLEKVRAAVGGESERLALVPLDVTSEEQAKKAIDAAVEKFRRIDVLVNNAGYSLLGNLESLTTEQIVGWMRMMAITPLTLAGGREVLVNWRGVVAAELTAT